MVVVAAKVTGRRPNDELLNSLKDHAGALNQQRASFTTILGHFSVVGLYEQNPTSIGMVKYR